MSALSELIASVWNGGMPVCLPEEKVSRATTPAATPSPRRQRRSPSKAAAQFAQIDLPDDYQQDIETLVGYALSNPDFFNQNDILLRTCQRIRSPRSGTDNASLTFFQRFFETLLQTVEKDDEVEQRDTAKIVLKGTWFRLAIGRGSVGYLDETYGDLGSQIDAIEPYLTRLFGEGWVAEWRMEINKAPENPKRSKMDELLQKVWQIRGKPDRIYSIDLSHEGCDALTRAQGIKGLVEKLLLDSTHFLKLDLLFWSLEGLKPEEQLENFRKFFTEIIRRIQKREEAQVDESVAKVYAKMPELLRHTLMRLVGRSRRFSTVLDHVQNTKAQCNLDRMADVLFALDKTLASLGRECLQSWLDEYKQEVRTTLQQLKPKWAKSIWIALVCLFWDFWHWWGWSTSGGYTVRDVWLQQIMQHLGGLHNEKSLVKERFYWFFYPMVVYGVKPKEAMGFLELELYRREGREWYEAYKNNVTQDDEKTWREEPGNPMDFEV